MKDKQNRGRAATYSGIFAKREDRGNCVCFAFPIYRTAGNLFVLPFRYIGSPEIFLSCLSDISDRRKSFCFAFPIYRIAGTVSWSVHETVPRHRLRQVRRHPRLFPVRNSLKTRCSRSAMTVPYIPANAANEKPDDSGFAARAPLTTNTLDKGERKWLIRQNNRRYTSHSAIAA